MSNLSQKLLQQIEFIREIDALKLVIRQNYIFDESRRENTAEHSWHIIIVAIMFFEFAPNPNTIDQLKVLKMLALHDICEIFAGDTFFLDVEGHKDKFERELASFEKILSRLPDTLKSEWLQIWKEFENGTTQEAQYALMIDRIVPVILNSGNNGLSWKKHAVTKEQITHKLQHIQMTSEEIWSIVTMLIEESHTNGSLL